MSSRRGRQRQSGVMAAVISTMVIATLVLLLVVSPAARLAVDAFLLAFRVQERAVPLKIIVAPLPRSPVTASATDATDTRTLASLVRLQLIGGQPVAAVEDAQALVSFDMERLNRFPRPSAITVYEHGTVQASLDPEATRQLASSLSGREVSLPPSVADTVVRGAVDGAVRQRWDTLGLSLTYWQLVPPHLETVSGPDIDLLRSQIAQAYLAIDPQVGQQLLNVQNWDQTVVVPVPPGAHQRSVRVNRQLATLVESPSPGGADSFLVWQVRGVFNYFHAPVTGDQLLSYAQSVSGGA